MVDRVIDYSKINNQKTTKRVSIKKREVIFNNVKHLTNIINRNSIKLKDRLNGPLIIEEESATTVVSPKYFVNKDLMGNLIIKRKNK